MAHIAQTIVGVEHDASSSTTTATPTHAMDEATSAGPLWVLTLICIYEYQCVIFVYVSAYVYACE